MSLGTSYLHSILREGAQTAFREVREDLLLTEEKPLFLFIRNHLNQHGVLPTPQTVRTQGIQLPNAPEPPQYYRDEVRKRFLFTGLSAAHQALAAALRPPPQGSNQVRDPDAAFADLQGRLSALGMAGRSNTAQCVTMREQLHAVLDDMREYQFSGGMRGVTLGFPTLDFLTGGLEGGDLAVVAGRPGMGKSWVLMEMAYKAWESGLSSLFVSMEMSEMQIGRRWLGRHAGVNPKFLRTGEVSSWVSSHLTQSVDSLGASIENVRILSGSMSKEVADIERAIQDHLPDIIFVDAAYLLSASKELRKSGASRWEELTEVIRELKQLALRYNRPIVISVQFNRNVRSGSSQKELDLRDIGGSDAIPQDASIVLGMRYGPAPLERLRRLIQMMKNREGETEDILITFGFSPPRLEEVPLDEDGGEVSTTENQSDQWML